MKNIILILLLLITSTVAYNQTEASLDETRVTYNEGQQSVSFGNSWLNMKAKLLYALNEGADFKENILFTVKFRKNLYTSTTFNLPLASNISLGDWGDVNDNMVVLSDAGVSIGLYPYLMINRGDLTIVPHFELSAKVLPGTSLADSPKRYKAGGNIELQLARADGEKNTLSAGVFYSSNRNLETTNMYGFDLTSLIALDGNSALLIDYKRPFKGVGLLSLGIVVK